MSANENSWEATAETLVALGAPLAGWRASLRLPAETALLNALFFAQRDASLLRSLPVMLARNWRELDWPGLERDARARGFLNLLGMLAEMAGSMALLPELVAKAQAWWQLPREPRHLFAPRNAFDRELAERTSPPVARKWGFLMNVGEDSFRALFDRHADQV